MYRLTFFSVNNQKLLCKCARFTAGKVICSRASNIERFTNWRPVCVWTERGHNFKQVSVQYIFRRKKYVHSWLTYSVLRDSAVLKLLLRLKRSRKTIQITSFRFNYGNENVLSTTSLHIKLSICALSVGSSSGLVRDSKIPCGMNFCSWRLVH